MGRNTGKFDTMKVKGKRFRVVPFSPIGLIRILNGENCSGFLGEQLLLGMQARAPSAKQFGNRHQNLPKVCILFHQEYFFSGLSFGDMREGLAPR